MPINSPSIPRRPFRVTVSRFISMYKVLITLYVFEQAFLYVNTAALILENYSGSTTPIFYHKSSLQFYNFGHAT